MSDQFNNQFHNRFERADHVGTRRTELSAMERASQDAYRSQDTWAQTVRNDDQAVRHNFGNLQIVDTGRHVQQQQRSYGGFGGWRDAAPPVAPERPCIQQPQHVQQSYGGFGGWKEYSPMPQPAPDRQSLMHTLQRSINTDMRFHSYAREQQKR